MVRELVDAWNSHDVDRICAFMCDDFENWQAPIGTVRGVPAYRAHLERWFHAYPDLYLRIDTLFADGDLVCLETTATGTPSSSFFGVRSHPGKENRALDVLELRGGRVARQRGFWDFQAWTGMPAPQAQVDEEPRVRSPEQLARAWCVALTRRDADAFAELFAADATLVDVEHRTPDLGEARPIRGRHAIRQLTIDWLEQTPAFEFDVTSLLADGDQVAYRWRYGVGVETDVRLDGITWLSCRAGEIREALVVFDSYRLLHALGRAAPTS